MASRARFVSASSAFFSFGLLVFCCNGLSAKPYDPTLDWRAVLEWFPSDTQTVIVANQPFIIPDVEKRESSRDDESFSPTETLQALALGRIGEFPALYQALVGQKAKFAVAGVRKFRPPAGGLGLGLYDGCSVIVFEGSLGDSLRASISGSPSENWLGSTVFFLTAEREGSLRSNPEQSKLLVTQLGSDVLVAATDSNSLHTFLKQRKDKKSGGRIRGGVSIWSNVDVESTAWAMRHFTGSGTSKKKNFNDSGAIGVVYNAQPPGPIQKVYYFSKNQQIVEICRNQWEIPQEGLDSPNVRISSKGVAEVVVPTVSDQAKLSFLFFLCAQLGFAIFV